ncbi:L,D-transpeptidase [Mycobacterium spongiae]|uniref:L,D-transpeptidase family protein n=1 Tax=Mycobacterium spongiae TaxID=886343 RepID=A0A975JWG0_9MYCO|nr:L,D-transpeptidase family protein [Mycobacterium spongiae]QUR65948.1 L,D-transpeptidase family protein [Mycobacterium spongiae]
MSRWTRGRLFAVVIAAGVLAVPVFGTGTALADPDPGPGDPGVVAPPGPPPPPPPGLDPLALPPAPDPLAPPPPAPDPLAPPPPPPNPFGPPPPDPLAVPMAMGPVAGQNPTPFFGIPPFRPPTFNPIDGSMVGVAKPIIINFAVPIADRGMAESAIHISSIPPVPGKFYWMTPTQVRWRPFDFWPANTAVNIDAAGTKSSFRTGDSLVATADDATHQMTITRNGVVEKTFPMSMGMAAGHHQTPNGTYYVLEKMPTVVMDSSTYGVPVNSSWGYKLTVHDAVRIDNSGNFVHSAPWSVSDQGKRNVTHGCINLGPANAKWFFDNFGSGDPIVVKNSVGSYTQNDGAQDWQI